MMGGAPPQSQTQQTNQAEQSTSTSSVVRKPLWYIDDTGKLAAVMVQVGISDTTKTEIIGADSLEGKEVILKVKVN